MESERQLQYQLYLESDHWKGLRLKVLKRDGGRCVRCGSHRNLQVHHKFYRNQFEDSIPDDLVTLCRICHQVNHGIIPSRSSEKKVRARERYKRKKFKRFMKWYYRIKYN